MFACGHAHPWGAFTNGNSKRAWFVAREHETGCEAPIEQRYAYTARDRLRRFASYATANAAAVRMNRKG